MGHILSKILPFLASVFDHWQIWLSGGGLGGVIVIVVGLREKFSNKAISKRTYVYIFLIAFFLCSCFLSWVDKDDALLSLASNKDNEHQQDVDALKTAQASYGELKAQCQYQSGVVDTLGKQNRDQQGTINNCQTKALGLLTPPALRIESFPMQLNEPVPGGNFQSRFLAVTNRTLSPVTVAAACNRPIINMYVLPLTSSGGSTSSVSESRKNAFELLEDMQSPALGPFSPYVVVINHQDNQATCHVNVS